MVTRAFLTEEKKEFSFYSDAEPEQATSARKTITLELTATPDERQGWLYASLEGLDRWEAEHGLGGDDELRSR